MNNILLYALLIPTVIISIMAFRNVELFDKLKFNPSHIGNSKEWYRFFSYGIIHADYIHLLINMYIFWIFGKIVLANFQYLFQNLGNLYFLLLYVPAIGISVIPSYFKHKSDPFYNAVGASGAISAIVYVSIILNPNLPMGLLFIPFSLPAWIFGALYLIYTIIMSKKGNTKIGHSAHLWGAVYGMLFILLVEPRLYLWFFHQL